MLEAIIGVMGTAFLAVLGWAIQLSGEVKVIKAEHDGLKELIESKFDGVNQRLDRIEKAMNGHFKED